MAFWSNMEDTQSLNLYKKDDYFGSFLRSNREKVRNSEKSIKSDAVNLFDRS